ncbi:CpsD/CapB family tyrosine-protein kinase [Heliophilum fasciatum]|uniref:non-specific protein-tyrosine kinase n=1 Tax=Heliophilum fasciatum TaxID=35700 RepID=A0A4R2RJW6_9FIRM|nr:CpsD/CapB family tyrosine-protein kinase [Heliophilum fasciatum]MCW2278091.1 capsular exopolysaccharide synthesis family protein [Heliophilum fasciatum]TCP64162.1 capsular exopolysaccharide synthesis family protein [Heliophilum fasciatum]
MSWFSSSSKKKKRDHRQPERKVIALDNPKSPIAEAYRTLRTSIRFATAIQEQAKVFLFTSAGPREGKSTVTANVAVTFAQNGTKTLLIDCDLRKPVQHKIFHVSNSVGLTNVLVDKCPEVDAINLTSIPQLDVMTSGPIPPNPSELLSSPRMQDLLDDLRQRYDLILIDTPPAVAVTDPVVLASHVDGIFLVIRAKQATIEMAKLATTRLQQSQGRIIGAILNGMEIHGEDYYYYYYYGGSQNQSE